MFIKYLTRAVIILLIPALSYANEHNNESSNDHGQHEEQAHANDHSTTQDHHEEKDHHEHNENKVERIQVRASRLGRIVTESATRTEIINAEEVQEKALMRPGNISMLVAETGGVSANHLAVIR